MSSQTLYAVPSFLGLVLSLALAGLVLARFERTTVHWAFAAAMVALGLAQLGNGLSYLADSPEGILRWHRVALAGEILMSASWLVFSLTFARSNAKALLHDWRGALAVAGLVTTVCLALIGSDQMFALVERGDRKALSGFGSPWRGICLRVSGFAGPDPCELGAHLPEGH